MNTLQSIALLSGCLLMLNTGYINASSSTSQDVKQDIPLDGEWREKKRSVQDYEFSISVAWDGTYLYIESTTGRSEIQVSLSNGFQATIPMGTTSTAIYVGELDDPCELELTNQFGDRVVGVIE